MFSLGLGQPESVWAAPRILGPQREIQTPPMEGPVMLPVGQQLRFLARGDFYSDARRHAAAPDERLRPALPRRGEALQPLPGATASGLQDRAMNVDREPPS